MVNGYYEMQDVTTYLAKGIEPNNKVVQRLSGKRIELLNNSIKILENMRNNWQINMSRDMDDFINLADKNLRELKGVIFVDDPMIEEYEGSPLGMFFVIEKRDIPHYNQRWGINIQDEGKYIAISPYELEEFYKRHRYDFAYYRGNLKILSELTFLHEVGHLAASVSPSKYNKYRDICESQANWFAALFLDFNDKYLLGEKTKFQPPEYQDFFTDPRYMPGRIYINPVNGSTIDEYTYDKKVDNMLKNILN